MPDCTSWRRDDGPGGTGRGDRARNWNKTVVVLKTAGMVLMPWLGNVPALVEAWFPGQHDGDVGG